MPARTAAPCPPPPCPAAVALLALRHEPRHGGGHARCGGQGLPPAAGHGGRHLLLRLAQPGAGGCAACTAAARRSAATAVACCAGVHGWRAGAGAAGTCKTAASLVGGRHRGTPGEPPSSPTSSPPTSFAPFCPHTPPCAAAMEMSQMVTQGLWQRDPVLMQLPHFTRDLAAACAAEGALPGEVVAPAPRRLLPGKASHACRCPTAASFRP